MKHSMTVRTYNNEIGPRIELSWAAIQFREGPEGVSMAEVLIDLEANELLRLR